MSRRNETIWWCCVCLLLSMLTGMTVYRFSASPDEPPSTDAKVQEAQAKAARISFEAAQTNESRLIREANRLLAVSQADEAELRRILDGYADGTFQEEAEFPTPIHIIRRYAEIDPEAALSYVLGHEHWAQYASTVFLEWAQSDVESAIAALDRLGPLNRMSAEQLILQAHKHAPLDSYIALQNRLRSSNNDAAFPAWAIERIRVDPHNGWSDVARADADYPERHYAWIYASEWSETDAVAALDAFNELAESAPDTYEASFTELLESVSMNKPRRALLWLEGQPPDASSQAMAPLLLRNLALRDPLDALNRAAFLPGSMRAESEQAILDQWRHFEPEQAAEWLMNYGDPASLQDVLPLLALSQPDSARARRLANLITNNETRNEILEQVGG